MDKNTIIPISLSVEAINYITNIALGGRPHAEVESLVNDIRMQANAYAQNLKEKKDTEEGHA